MARFDTPDDVLECLWGYSASAALGAALELGLPWLLADAPLEGSAVAAALGIPLGRCGWWLQVLVRLGLLERRIDGYILTPGARRAIVESYAPDSWAFLAQEDRERLPVVVDLARRLVLPPGHSRLPEPLPDYVARMAVDPERARRFTRMLYDLHGPLAECLAAALDLAGVRRLLDLGGGSGVMSLALLRKNPALSVVVADIPAVCAEGRRIAREKGLEDRISFWEGDLLSGELPRGFGAVLECDVGVYDAGLLAAVRPALDEGGRFFVADLLPESEDDYPDRVLHWGFTGSLSGGDGARPTWLDLEEQLRAAGFEVAEVRPLIEGFRLLEARRGPGVPQ
ncbi:MAG: methyltransferase [Acidimicrobiia bacterium]|nr:methyltransferase [Acidimicrobiia bacterium]